MATEDILLNLFGNDSDTRNAFYSMMYRLRELGDFDPLAIVSTSRKDETFIEALLRTKAFTARLDSKIINDMNEWAGGKLDTPGNIQKSILRQMFFQADGISTFGETEDEMMASFISISNNDVAKCFEVVERNGNIMNFFLSRGCTKTIEELGKNGMLLSTHRDDSGLSARNIKTVEQWDLFIEQGGDPAASIDGQPLWLIINKKSHGQLEAKTREWGSINDSKTKESEDDARYWSKLSNVWRTEDASKALKSIPDWATKKNSEGMSAMMALVANKPKHYVAFKDIKKAAPYFDCRDKEGRNLWSYFIRKGRECPAGCVRWLSDNVPMSPDNEGRGTFLQSLGWNELNSFFYHGDESNDSLCRAIKKDPEGFWRGTKEQFDEIGDLMCNAMYISKGSRTKGATDTSAPSSVKSVVHIVEKGFEDMENLPCMQSKKFLGGLLVFLISDYKANTPIVDKLLDMGACIDFDADTRDGDHRVAVHLETKVSEERRLEILSRLDSNRLSMKIQSKDRRNTLGV